MNKEERLEGLSKEEELTSYMKKKLKYFWGNNYSAVHTYYQTFYRPKEELLKKWHAQMRSLPSGKK